MNLDFAWIEHILSEKMDEHKIPSIAFSVITDKTVAYTGLFGSKNLETDEKPDADTRYGCASLTKAFTATCLGILRDEGKIDWQTPVNKYIPGFAMFDNIASAGVTLADMLTHNTGVPRHDFSWYGYLENDRPTAEYVARIAHLKPNKPFRTKYEYNNFMFATAGHVVEKIADMPLKDFMKKRIFDPLGMKNTSCEIAGLKTAENSATPYRMYKNEPIHVKYLNFDGLAGAGALNSTVNDMQAWVSMNMNGGEYGGVRIISEKTLAEIHTPRNTVPPMPGMFIPQKPLSSYAFGWSVEPYRGILALNHSGNTDGFCAYTTFMPQHKLGIILMINLQNSPFHFALAAELYDRILGIGDGTDWFKFYYDRREVMLKELFVKNDEIISARKPEAKPSRELAQFAGKYSHPGYGELEIEHENGALWLSFNAMRLQLNHNNFDTFEFSYEKADPERLVVASFSTGVNGEVSGVSIPLEPSLDEMITFKRIK